MEPENKNNTKKKYVFLRIIALLLILGIGGTLLQLPLAFIGLRGPIAYIIADGGALLIGYFLLFR